MSGDAGETCTFVVLSDTHNQHSDLGCLPQGDVLLHCGDLTKGGTLAELAAFATWWHAQPHKQKVVIAGNHDACLCTSDAHLEGDGLGDVGTTSREELAAQAASLLVGDPGSGCSYLLDSGCVTTAGGFTIHGAPWTPRFWGAFNLDRGEAIAARWAVVPANVDVLVTHGPPLGCRDFVPRVQEHVGCAHLAEEVTGRIRPAVHCFGHIHEGHGTVCHDGIRLINASITPWSKLGQPGLNPPTVFTLRREPGGAVAVYMGADAAAAPAAAHPSSSGAV